MKCLEKDRNRRYDTANGLAIDIQHHLNDEPVLACPPSAAYRLKKIVRRNKVATLVAILAIIASTALAVKFVHKTRSERIAAAFQLAEAYAEAQRHTDAEQHYRSLLSLVTDDEQLDDARRRLAVCLLRQGKSAEGVQILKDRLHEKILRFDTRDAKELRDAWPNLPNGDVITYAPADQDGLEFDGDQDYVVLPNVYFDGRPPWTLEAIVNPFKFKYRGKDEWISLVSAAELGSIALEINPRNWAIELYSKSDFFGGTGVQWETSYVSASARPEVVLNQWQHVAGIWDGRELRIYVNGQLHHSRPGVEYCTRLSHWPFFLGADPSSYWRNEVAEGCFGGRLRAARISRSTEYTESFAAPQRLEKTPGTIGLYDFTIHTGRYAIDRSGHGNHGIIIGAKFVNARFSGDTASDVHSIDQERVSAPPTDE
jgi:hypothetical protein